MLCGITCFFQCFKSSKGRSAFCFSFFALLFWNSIRGNRFWLQAFFWLFRCNLFFGFFFYWFLSCFLHLLILCFYLYRQSCNCSLSVISCYCPQDIISPG